MPSRLPDPLRGEADGRALEYLVVDLVDDLAVAAGPCEVEGDGVGCRHLPLARHWTTANRAHSLTISWAGTTATRLSGKPSFAFPIARTLAPSTRRSPKRSSVSRPREQLRRAVVGILDDDDGEGLPRPRRLVLALSDHAVDGVEAAADGRRRRTVETETLVRTLGLGLDLGPEPAARDLLDERLRRVVPVHRVPAHVLPHEVLLPAELLLEEGGGARRAVEGGLVGHVHADAAVDLADLPRVLHPLVEAAQEVVPLAELVEGADLDQAARRCGS